MRKPIDVVLPDTGPLISMAVADRLDLFQSFERPVLIPDVVREECLSRSDKLGYSRLRDWFTMTGRNQFRIVDTPFIDTYRKLAAEPRQEGRRPPHHGMGEATLMWTIANIEEIHAHGAVCLVITEDGRAGDTLPRLVHALSTRAWLEGLENIGFDIDAGQIISSIAEKGRIVSPYSRDQRGTDADGNRTDWRRQVERALQSGL